MKITFVGVSLGWFLKILSVNPLYLSVADSFHKLFHRLSSSAIEVINYDLMTDDLPKSEKDEAMILRELSIDFSAALSYFVAATLIAIGGFKLLFAAAALISLVIPFLTI